MNNVKIRRAAAVLAAGVALVAAGCGGDDSSDDPAEAVSSLYEAAGDGDAERMCELMSANAQEQAQEAEGTDSCEEAVEAELSGGAGELIAEIEVGEADVEGESGTVEISALGQSDTVNVVQEDGEWKVDEDS